MTRRSLRQFVGGDINGIRGTTAIEFAIIAPVLMLMTICTIDMGIGFYRYMQVESAAGVGAQSAALHGFNTSNIASAITNATSYSGISASPAPSQFCGCPSTSGIEVATCGSTCTGGAAAGTYVTTSAQSTYTPIMSYPLLPSSFTLSAQSTMRIQ
jgi:Flp pilus assembly protein TadG